MELSRLAKLYQESSQERDQFRSQMNDIYKLCIPSKNNWATKNNISNKGKRTDLEAYNSKPISSTKKFGAKLVSLIAPNGTQFFDVGLRHKLDDAQQQRFDQAAAHVAKEVLNHLNNSNFYQALNESFVDLAAGMGGILINWDSEEDELYFKALDMSRVCVLEDNRGVLNYVFREIGTLSKEDQARLYPHINFGENQSITVVESVVRENGKYVYRITDDGFSKCYSETTSSANPFVIFRWDRRPGENRGRGLLNDLLGTVKLTNVIMSDTVDAAARVNSPPYITDKSSIMNPNNVKIAPNSLIVLANADSRFEPLPFNGNLPFALSEIKMFNDEIDDALMINILGQVGQGQLTATEVDTRMQLAAEVLGQFYSRIQREMLTPMFSRVIELLQDNYLIELFNYDANNKQHKLSYSYSSPIMNMTQQIKCQKLLQSMQYVATIAGQQAQQYLNAAFKIDEIPYYVADSLGVDMSMVNTVEETKDNLQQQQQAQQQAMQQQQQAALQMEILKRQSNPALSPQVAPLGGE